MRKVVLYLIATLFASALIAREPLPRRVEVRGHFPFHVQGMAVDTVARCFYLSFTNRFVKVDYEGNVTASVDSINGHIGAMTFDYERRKVYASLEYKSDAIGRSISEGMGEKAYSREDSRFCIAEIEVDRLDRLDKPVSEVLKAYEVLEVKKDYLNKYGCSGIDGITIAPTIGKGRGRRLYLAYGIYGDTTRTDNDHQIILEYRLNRLFKPSRKLFVYTGNTTYGVQNMAYDSFTDNFFLACYGGKKKQFPNFSLFAVPDGQDPVKRTLKGLEDDGQHLRLSLAGAREEEIRGWYFTDATTGFCPLGDGLWYVSKSTGTGKRRGATIILYRWTGDAAEPFTKVE